MKIITPLQCRAGRAMLDLSRDDLAKLSSVAAGTIGAFETEKVESRVQAVSLLRLALESAGAEFLDTDGVRLRRGNIRSFEGSNAHRQLLDEVYSDVKETGGEVLIKGVDEDRWSSGDDAAFLAHHIDRLVKAEVTERLLVSDAFPTVATHTHWYRKLPAKYFSPHTQWIFAGKVAMVTWGDIEKIIVIESPELFDSATREFNCLWDHVGKPLD